jgi:hypothetical protein
MLSMISPTASMALEGRASLNNMEQLNKNILSKSIEFEIESFLKSGNNIGGCSPSFLPLSPPRLVDDAPGYTTAPFYNPFDASNFDNPFSTIMESAPTTKFKPIVIKELPGSEKKRNS